MQVELPHDPDRAWRDTLTEWERDTLVEVARGEYNDYRGHHRMVVVVTEYGFDIIGLRRAAVMDSSGAPIPDAWVIAWVDEVHGSSIHCDPFSAHQRYGAPERTIRHQPSERYEARKRWGHKYARTLVRRRRRARRTKRRRLEREAAYTAAYEKGLAAHVAEGLSPYTYVHDESDVREAARRVGQGLRNRFISTVYGEPEEGDDDGA